MKPLIARAAGVLADTINDANSTRKVYLLAAGLAVLGLALIAITVWFWRSTRHDPELLGPLEVLGDRKFRKLDGSEQRQVLDGSRPNEAKPLQWGVERGAAADDPAVTASAFDAALMVADDAPVEPATVAALADAPVDPHSDLDSILAAAGAVVPGRPAPSDPASSNGAPVQPTDNGSSVADPSAAGAAAGPLVADPAADPDAPVTVSEPAAPEPAVAPLLIVPVDHDLRPSVSRTVEPGAAREPALEPVERIVAADDDLDDDFDDAADEDFEDDHDESVRHGEFDRESADADDDADASIDPLLRMFNRNDT